MVTRTVIHVASPEAAALKTSSSAAAAEDSIKNAPTSTKKSTKNNGTNRNGGGKKRALPSGGAIISSEGTKKRQKSDRFVLDLSDVPPQPPIPKRKERIKEGSSKYTGVSFVKSMSKWKAEIKIDGKTRHIGYYEKEEEAAIDYARAVFKYQGEDALDKAREYRKSALVIDLSDVPIQPPIPKKESQQKGRACDRYIKEGSSKYAGVTFHNARNKWKTQIKIDGKSRYIGCYENEEEAAIDYARAVFKYKGEEALAKLREQKSSRSAIDLSDVPPRQPIPKREGHMKEGSSKYTGVYFNTSKNKWEAATRINGKTHHIGCYENEEEAAIDYARAVFKYKGQEALDKVEGAKRV